MGETNDRIATITRDTLVPIAIVIALVVTTWTIANGPVQQIALNKASVIRHDEELKLLREGLTDMARSLARIEAAVGSKLDKD